MKIKLRSRQKKLAGKLTTKLIIGMTLAFLLLIGAISNSTKNDLVVRESEKLVLLAKENANVAKQFMETMINKQDVLMAALSNIENVNDERKIEFTSDLIDSVKSDQDDILSVFFIAEPNTFVADSPNGFSVFATAEGTFVEKNQFSHVNETLYAKAKSVTGLTIIDPFEKTIDGKNYTVITVLQPVYDSAKNYVGLLGSNIDTAVLNGATYNNGDFTSFSNQIICGHNTFIIHSTNPAVIGKNFNDVTVSTNPDRILKSANSPEPFTFLDTDQDGSKNYRAFIPFYVGTSKVIWLSGSSISKEEFDLQIIKQIIDMLVITFIGLIVLSIFSYLLINRALKPIGLLESAAKKMAKGNLDIDIKYSSNDELGSLAESIRESIDTLSFYINDIDRAMSELATGNFNVIPSRPFIGDFAHIESSITKFITTISKALEQINMASEQVSTGSEIVASSSQIMAQGSAKQSSSVESLSSTIIEISSQIEVSANSASSANKRALEVGYEINQGNIKMSEMVTAMDHIIRSSEEIKKIIKTIDDIAFQTNILALNASVEAARAGTAGKGFAVVADEVRNLAAKSTEAVKNSSEMIQTSISAVQIGSQIANDTAKSLTSIVKDAGEMVDIIDKIAKVTAEQSALLTEVTLNVKQISGVISSNSATAEESASASEELSSQAQMLKSLVNYFKVKKQI